MADDAGALLVRSGLVSSSALDEARSKMADLGGTVGEQLVANGIVADDALTDFYKQRLLVPQVNPNTLARLPAKVVAVIPSDMAIELRAIPVSLDNDNNLTVAMSDPSDRHAVDEISFFTGAYVVRAVATQMQIAWCLAHYYGHVTHLGKRLLQPDVDLPPERVQAAIRPRPRGMTGEVDAMRHRGLVPGEASVKPNDTEEMPAVSDNDETNAKNPRARSISGEIRVVRRAASIKPPMPEDDSGPIVVMEMEAGEPSGPQITIEAGEPGDGDDTDPAKLAAPKRKRPAEPDPPELFARAGEVEMKSVDRDVGSAAGGSGPSIVVEEMLDAPSKQSIEVSGEIAVRDRRDGPAHPHISVEVSDEDSAPVMIREQSQPAAVESAVVDEASAPILLDRKRPSDPPATTLPDKRPRGERRTAMGLGAVGRSHRDTIEAAPSQLDDDPTGRRKIADPDPTRVDAVAAPPRDDTSSDEILAAPPSPIHGDDTSPIAAPPPPVGPGAADRSPRPAGLARASTPLPSGQIQLANVKRKAVLHDDDDDDDDGPKSADVHGGKPTMVMTAVELDETVPGRVEAVPAHLVDKTKPNVDYDPVDDGWGPPGTTIPPPLLGGIPGVDDTRSSGSIPIPNLDSQPLMVAPPSPPEHARPHTTTQAGIARALEQATERMLDLIRDLEHATDRDAVVETMIGHLAETHRRAGFFAVRGGELSLFSITPNIVVMPTATVRLDRPSTLQDVVGTRLPYRGPMHDETSRMFLQAVLGVCPPEILLVPITVRERVVGVLFGEHRMRHTFDDQLALAGRAAGNALERILKSKRG